MNNTFHISMVTSSISPKGVGHAYFSARPAPVLLRAHSQAVLQPREHAVRQRGDHGGHETLPRARSTKK